MDDNGRPNHIEDALCEMHSNQWFGWTDGDNKIYSNLKLSQKIGVGGNIIDNPVTELPTEEEVNSKLSEIQVAFDDAKTKRETDKANANQKLKDLGLTDDEIKAIKGID